MSEAKPTPKPWWLDEYGNLRHGSPRSRDTLDVIGVSLINGNAAPERMQQATSNRNLLLEAGTVYHQTGLTPSQLVERVKELEGALGGITAMCEQQGDFRNGVTDPTGTIDEGNVVAGRVIQSARAALAKCEGVKP